VKRTLNHRGTIRTFASRWNVSLTTEKILASDINPLQKLQKADHNSRCLTLTSRVTPLCVREGRILDTSFHKYPRWRIEEPTKLRMQGKQW
jgi:hypothetical protein